MAAEIPDGAFIVARRIFNSSIWTMRDQDRLLAITLIGIANWKPAKWFDGGTEIVIGRGELVRSLEALAEASRLSVQNVRTGLKRLQNVGFLTRKPTRRYTHLVLTKYSEYQDLSRYADKEWPQELTQGLTRDQHAGNTGVTRDQHAPNNKQESKESKEREESKEASARQDSIGLLLQRAKAAKIPNNPDTIRRYLEAWVARKGAGEVERVLMLPEAQGLNVLQLDKWHFNGDQSPKSHDDQLAEMLTHLDEEKKRRESK